MKKKWPIPIVLFILGVLGILLFKYRDSFTQISSLFSNFDDRIVGIFGAIVAVIGFLGALSEVFGYNIRYFLERKKPSGEKDPNNQLHGGGISIGEQKGIVLAGNNSKFEGDVVFANTVYQFPLAEKETQKYIGVSEPQLSSEIFIGREDEIENIKGEFSDTNTNCICVFGFAGVGKSALLRETLRVAHSTGLKIIGNGLLTLGPHETLAGLITRVANLDERSRFTKSDYEILSSFMGDYFLAPSVMAIDELRSQDAKLIADLNWFLETAGATGKMIALITASREKPPLKSTLPVEYIQIKPFGISQTNKLILELTKNEQIRKGFEHIFSASQGNPQLIKYLCKNEDVAQKIFQNLPVNFDILKEVWGSIRDSSFTKIIEIFSVFNVFSKEVNEDFAQELIPEWGSEKDKLLDRSLIDQTQPRLYKIHDLLANYVYDNLPKQKKHMLHDLLGEYFSSKRDNSGSIISFYHYVAAENIDNSIKLHTKIRDLIKQTTYSPLLIKSLLELKSIIKHDDKSLRAQVLESLGYVYVLTDDYKESESNWVEAKKLFEETNDKRGLAWSTHGLAIINRMRANFSLALKDYKLAESHFRSIGDLKGTAWTLRDQSEILRSIGKYDVALDTAMQSLNLSRSINDQLGVAATLRTIGDLYFTQSRFNDAFSTYSEALNISEQIDAKMNQGYVLNAMSHLCRITHKLPDAVDFSKQSLQILRSIQDNAGICFTKFGLAEGLRMTGKHTEALDEYISANQIAFDIGHNDFVSYNLLGMAELYRTMGDYSKALYNGESALEHSRRYNVKIVEAHSLLSISETKRLLGNTEQDLYDLAYSLYKEMKSNWGIIHVLIGKVLSSASAGDSLQNNSYLEQAKHISKDNNYAFELKYIEELKPKDIHPLYFPLM